MSHARIPSKLLLLVALLLIVVFEVYFLYKKSTRESISMEQGLAECLAEGKSEKDKGLCIRELATSVYKHFSTYEIEESINKVNDPTTLQWCHEFVHYIGWEIYDDKKSVFDSFQEASGVCDSGMYHGVMEKYLEDQNIALDNIESLDHIADHACEDTLNSNDNPKGLYWICYHGLGHGFMFITENDLPTSLTYCDLVPPGYSGSCYTGAFMESISGKQVGKSSSHPSKFAKGDDPNYPCNILDEKYKDECYKYRGVYFVVSSKGDFAKSFESCLSFEKQYQNACFLGIGSNIPGPFMTTYEATQKCKLALAVSPEAYVQCIHGAMTFHTELNHGNPKASAEFCSYIEDDYKEVCYKAAGANLRNWLTSSETIEDKCSSFETHARELCLNPN